MTARFTRAPGKPVVLYVAPGLPYREVVAVYDRLLDVFVAAGGVGAANISIPTQSDIRAYLESFGVDPFQTRCPS